ncbi:MAG TPA: hypothetical protein VIF62_08140 [Labilithrix sp.]
MIPDDFKGALLRSAKRLDGPPDGAKARAIAQLAMPVASAAATATAATAKAATIAWWIAGTAAIAGASGYGVARITAPATTTTTVTATVTATTTTTPIPTATATATPTPTATASANEAPADACASAPSVEPNACSSPGKNPLMLAIEIKNTCASDVDVYWVDSACKEVFRGRLRPGEILRNGTSEAHVFRLRDHATRRLLKETSAHPIPGAHPLTADAAAIAIPSVVLRETDAALPDEPPAVCSYAGAEATMTFVNERSEGVLVMYVDHECREKYWGEVSAHATKKFRSVEGDAWRIRDRSGALLAEHVPTAPDPTTYVSVP